MSSAVSFDDDLARRLPLPLARLYRQAHNAKAALDRHQAAYFLWEASLKLLGSTAIVSYAQRAEVDPRVEERLQNLARPSVGHWWEFVRLLLPVLAEGGDAGFKSACDFLLGPKRNDLPRCAGLDATLCEVLDGKAGARSTVRVSELFDNMVRYRNRAIGHGALGKQSTEYYQRVGRALFVGVSELLSRFDVLAGRTLTYLSGLQPKPSGEWEVDLEDSVGEMHRRQEPQLLAEEEASHLPRVDRMYLQHGPRTDHWTAVTLYPLVIYDPATEEVLFLNSRRGKKRTEYLCYSSGRLLERDDLGGEQRELLRRLLKAPVDEKQFSAWQARSQAEEPKEAETAAEPEQPLRRIGEFEIISELGRGGMARVFRAWQPSLGRQVAVKCLIRSGDKSEQRFAQEIHALGQVHHPSLVQVFTSGAVDDQWYYTMELVEGATLASICESLESRSSNPSQIDLITWHQTVSTVCEQNRGAEKPLSSDAAELLTGRSAPPEVQLMPALEKISYVRQVADLIRQVAEAVDALHQHPLRIVHRDIKPGNIMVTADGQRAVLMDLGLAKILEEGDRKLTYTRQFVGTLRYASPEQILSIKLDGRTDVYSLGATLWELLTLRPIYDATDEVATPEIMRRIQFDEAESVRKHHPGIPAALEAIVAKCLEKNPQHRYASAGELAADLRSWLRNEQVQASKSATVKRVGKFVRRQRRKLAVVAGLALIGVLAGVWIFKQPKTEPVIPSAIATVTTTSSSTTSGTAQPKTSPSSSPRSFAEINAEKAELERKAAEMRARVARLTPPKEVAPQAVAPLPKEVAPQTKEVTPQTREDKASILFADSFSKLDRSWRNGSGYLKVENNKLIQRPPATIRANNLNEGGLFDDMDASVDIQMSQAGDANWYAGISFWAADIDNCYIAGICPKNGNVSVLRITKGRELSPFPWEHSDAVKQGADAINHVRVVTKGAAITVYVNDKEVASFNGQPPDGGGMIGLVGSSGEELYVWQFANLVIKKPSH